VKKHPLYRSCLSCCKGIKKHSMQQRKTKIKSAANPAEMGKTYDYQRVV
jgi:hypothetical protein